MLIAGRGPQSCISLPRLGSRRRGTADAPSQSATCCTAINQKLQVVFVSTEVAPWSKTGGLSDVVAALPAALASRGHQVMTVSPRYADYPGVYDTGLLAPVEVAADLLPPPPPPAPHRAPYFPSVPMGVAGSAAGHAPGCVSSSSSSDAQPDRGDVAGSGPGPPQCGAGALAGSGARISGGTAVGPLTETLHGDEKVVPDSSGSTGGTVAPDSAGSAGGRAGAGGRGLEAVLHVPKALTRPPPHQQQQLDAPQASRSGVAECSPTSTTTTAATQVSYARFYACQDRGVLRVFVDHPIFRLVTVAGGDDGDGAGGSATGGDGSSRSDQVDSRPGSSSSSCADGTQQQPGAALQGNERKSRDPVLSALAPASDPSLGVYTYSEALGAADLQARNSVLCQAALAAPVLLWHDAEGLSQDLLDDLAAADCDSVLPRQALPFVLRNGIAQPAVSMDPGGFDKLREAMALRARSRAGSGSSSDSSPAGSRFVSPVGSRSSSPSERRATAVSEGIGSSGAPWDPGRGPQQAPAGKSELVFVGNDWPSALLPLWLQSYREVAASAAHFGALLRARLQLVGTPPGAGAGAGGADSSTALAPAQPPALRPALAAAPDIGDADSPPDGAVTGPLTGAGMGAGDEGVAAAVAAAATAMARTAEATGSASIDQPPVGEGAEALPGRNSCSNLHSPRPVHSLRPPASTRSPSPLPELTSGAGGSSSNGEGSWGAEAQLQVAAAPSAVATAVSIPPPEQQQQVQEEEQGYEGGSAAQGDGSPAWGDHGDDGYHHPDPDGSGPRNPDRDGHPSEYSSNGHAGGNSSSYRSGSSVGRRQRNGCGIAAAEVQAPGTTGQVTGPTSAASSGFSCASSAFSATFLAASVVAAASAASIASAASTSPASSASAGGCLGSASDLGALLVAERDVQEMLLLQLLYSLQLEGIALAAAVEVRQEPEAVGAAATKCALQRRGAGGGQAAADVPTKVTGVQADGVSGAVMSCSPQATQQLAAQQQEPLLLPPGMGMSVGDDEALEQQRRMRGTLRTFRRFVSTRLRGAKVVFTVHNFAFQGLFAEDSFWRLGLPLLAMQQMMLGGISGRGSGGAPVGAGGAAATGGAGVAAGGELMEDSGMSEGDEGDGGSSCEEDGSGAGGARPGSPGKPPTAASPGAGVGAAPSPPGTASEGSSDSQAAGTTPAANAGPALPSPTIRPTRSGRPRGLSWLRAALLASDLLVTVSPGYAQELVAGRGVAAAAGGAPGPGMPAEGSEELRDIIAARGLQGVMNGLESEGVWDPANDLLLSPRARYSRDTAAVGKAAAKAELQAVLGLEVDPATPLFAFVGRLEQQKGVDVVLAALPQLLGEPEQRGAHNRSLSSDGEASRSAAAAANLQAEAAAQRGGKGMWRLPDQLRRLLGLLVSPPLPPPPERRTQVQAAAATQLTDTSSSKGTRAGATSTRRMQVVMLGSGSGAGAGQQWLTDGLAALRGAYPRRAAGVVGLDEPLAHLLMAGADFLLVPSRWEPCGLVALAALRYGTLPVVAPTGGLLDALSPSVPVSSPLPPTQPTEQQPQPQLAQTRVQQRAPPPRPKDGAQHSHGALLGLVMDRPVGRADDSLAKREAVASLLRVVRQACDMYTVGEHVALRDRAMAADVSWSRPAQRWEQLLVRLATQDSGGIESGGVGAGAGSSESGAGSGPEPNG